MVGTVQPWKQCIACTWGCTTAVHLLLLYGMRLPADATVSVGAMFALKLHSTTRAHHKLYINGTGRPRPALYGLPSNHNTQLGYPLPARMSNLHDNLFAAHPCVAKL
ncbi:hypothetical protein COO60DRAFT_1028378 [Scenedesmus sp. NREL 46B-D3]|nr:hypothetical protein COO60DRAFT_1028378 [Scenedesmus sp. NREL 46B-D3]